MAVLSTVPFSSYGIKVRPTPAYGVSQPEGILASTTTSQELVKGRGKLGIQAASEPSESDWLETKRKEPLLMTSSEGAAKL